MNVKLILLLLATVVLFVDTASAVEDIDILPAVNPIDVNVYPNAISPPVNVTYTGWNTSGGTSYLITVTNDSSGAIVCSVNGTITGNPQIITLSDCVLPASSTGIPHTIRASGECPKGQCTNVKRGKYIRAGSPLNPIPELSTAVLMSAGLLGLFGVARLRRKGGV